MKNILILHGADNNSRGNWFPWLKNELEVRHYRVWSPDMPNSAVPDKKVWLNVVFSNKDWLFDKESVIVGHSAGATLTLRILEALPEGVKINKAIIVAGMVELGTKPEYFKYKKSLVSGSFDWGKIRRSVDNIYFIHSDNDSYQCGDDQGKIMHKNLGGKLIVKPGENHFNLEKGPQYKKFPLVLEFIEE